jgi:hypothetical protein
MWPRNVSQDGPPFFAPNEVKSTARSWKITMKDPYQVLKQKDRDIEGVRKEIKALHLAIPLLAEDADLIEPCEIHNGRKIDITLARTELRPVCNLLTDPYL